MNEFQNPILPGFHPDPTICRVGDDYYLTNSTFYFFPMLPVYHSRDLINWKLVNHGINREEQNYRVWQGGLFGIFAPTLRYHERLKKFFIIAAFCDAPDRDQRTFIISADTPEKEWSQMVFVDAQDNLDPSLFFDEDGNDYLQYVPDNQEGVYQYRIDLATGRRLSEPKMIWRGTGGRFPEGPHIFQRDGYYYLVIAEGGIQFGHAVCIARSRNIDGPYESCPGNPIMTHRNLDMQFSQIQSVGHADFVQDPAGDWWTVCLAFRQAGKDKALPLGRETFLAPVDWDEQGWPVVKNPGNPDGSISPTMHVNRDIAPKLFDGLWHDDFDADKLDIHWHYLRFVDTEFADVTTRPGWLTLTGLPDFMEPTCCSPLISRDQTNFNFTMTAKMEFTPKAEGDEAGLVVFTDERRHYEIGLARRNGKIVVLYRKTAMDISSETIIAEYDAELIYLAIVGDSDNYELRYGSSPDSLTTGGTGSTLLLSHHRNWCGNMLGPYCISKNNTTACFDWINYSI